MVFPMAALAAILGVGGWWVIAGGVEVVNDRILNASAQSIAESLAVENGEVILDLPPAALGMLENEARDSVFYSVRQGTRVITGYEALPAPDVRLLSERSAVFADLAYKGRPVRAVAQARRLPGMQGLVVVEVAETLDGRRAVVSRMLIGLAMLEATLIGLAFLLVPIAVRWGMRPLTQLREAVNRQRGSDFTPLPLGNVPTELVDVVEAFNGLLGRFDGAVKGIRRFTADASHQMRTPLAILRTHIGVLKQAVPGSTVARSSIADIDLAAERLRNLLLQLLSLARAEQIAPEAVQFETVAGGPLIRSIAADYVAQAIGARVDLRIDGDLNDCTLWTSPALAGELLGNLLDNAIRYNRPGGHVWIDAQRSDERTIVLVCDDGPGIAPADRERVFSRFERLDEKQSSGGSGLGLAIARAIAERLGIKIALSSHTGGQGLIVSVAFPRDRGEHKEPIEVSL